MVVDNAVDTTTGTIRLKAEVANADRILWPGQFVNVVLTLDTIANATLVPSEAVQTGPKGAYIYVVTQNQTVEPRLVAAGRQTGRRTIIQKGIEPGETVVIDGQLRLFPGARIRPVDAERISGSPL